MKTDQIENTTIKDAILALQYADKARWLRQFSAQAELYYNGRKENLAGFFETAFGHDHFNSLEMVNGNPSFLTGAFYSPRFGYFQAYIKFTIGVDSLVRRLQIGDCDSIAAHGIDL